MAEASGVTDNSDLAQVLQGLRDQTWERCVIASKRAKTWSRWSVALAGLATIGSGVAGATVAAGTLSSTARAVVAILAFAGAGLSGISAAVGAPGQAKTEVLKSDQLAALTRWIDLGLVDLPNLDRPNAETRIRSYLVWRDDIQGVTSPPAVRSPTPIEPTPTVTDTGPKAGAQPGQDPGGAAAPARKAAPAKKA